MTVIYMKENKWIKKRRIILVWFYVPGKKGLFMEVIFKIRQILE